MEADGVTRDRGRTIAGRGARRLSVMEEEKILDSLTLNCYEFSVIKKQS